MQHSQPTKANALRQRAHSLSLQAPDNCWGRNAAAANDRDYEACGKTHSTSRQRYVSLSCGSTESGYSSDALAQSAGVSRMSPWTSGGHAHSPATPAALETPTSPGYKFKSDIHLRFKAAELENEVGSGVVAPGDEYVEFKRKRAGFVLHREGRYYLPVQLAEDELPDVVRQIEGCESGHCESTCHPISISVRLAE